MTRREKDRNRAQERERVIEQQNEEKHGRSVQVDTQQKKDENREIIREMETERKRDAGREEAETEAREREPPDRTMWTYI